MSINPLKSPSTKHSPRRRNTKAKPPAIGLHHDLQRGEAFTRKAWRRRRESKSMSINPGHAANKQHQSTQCARYFIIGTSLTTIWYKIPRLGVSCYAATRTAKRKARQAILGRNKKPGSAEATLDFRRKSQNSSLSAAVRASVREGRKA